jgi:alanyl-tRNA synthetase
MEDARNMGATALFGDKYGDVVRVIKVADYSTELCGGTHVKNTGNIGLFKIVTETGIAAGTRRIEAITGMNALAYLNSLENKINETAEILKTDADNLVDRAQKNMEELRGFAKENERLNSKLASIEVDSIIENPKKIKDVNLIIKSFKNKETEVLREMIDKAKDKLKSCVVVFGADNGNAVFVAGVTKDLIDRGIKAGDIVKEVSKAAGGNGGGRPDFAQAGGKDGTLAAEALLVAEKLIESKI